jgi:hypothetical protein
MSERLTYDEAVAWSYARSGHFTSEPSKAMLLRLAEATVPARRTLTWTTPAGRTATVSYDAGQGVYWCSETAPVTP